MRKCIFIGMKSVCHGYLLVLALCLLMVSACSEDERQTRCLRVKASAYNSLPYQTRPGTSGDITAWGDRLVDTIPSIAISRDLIDSGLVYGSLVSIDGFKGQFVVNDKMNRRYRNRIDIHMGKDVKKARKFGVKKLGICWEFRAKSDSLPAGQEGL